MSILENAREQKELERSRKERVQTTYPGDPIYLTRIDFESWIDPDRWGTGQFGSSYIVGENAEDALQYFYHYVPPERTVNMHSPIEKDRLINGFTPRMKVRLYEMLKKELSMPVENRMKNKKRIPKSEDGANYEKISITVPPKDFKKLEAAVRQTGFSRSELIQEAWREFLEMYSVNNA